MEEKSDIDSQEMQNLGNSSPKNFLTNTIHVPSENIFICNQLNYDNDRSIYLNFSHIYIMNLDFPNPGTIAFVNASRSCYILILFSLIMISDLFLKDFSV
jgi:hypothetical protein